jgi:hypothetical protein
MKNKYERKIKRIQHRAHRSLLAKALGSAQAADKVMRQAADKRIKGDFCQCGDEMRYYRSRVDVLTDATPKVTCGDCGKTKLRVKIITDGLPTDKQQLFLTDLLK